MGSVGSVGSVGRNPNNYRGGLKVRFGLRYLNHKYIINVDDGDMYYYQIGLILRLRKIFDFINYNKSKLI